MARKSQASLSVVAPATKTRMAAPDDLTAEEASVWDQVIESKPVNWFDKDSAPLLMEYCRATVTCNLLAGRVSRALAEGAEDVKLWVELRDKESRRLTTIGTKLRLTQQSRYTPKAADTATRHAAGGTKPWEVTG